MYRGLLKQIDEMYEHLEYPPEEGAWVADEGADRARLDCHPIRFALEETDDGTILSGVAFPELGEARARAKRARQAVESSKKDALEGGLKAAEKEGGFFLHEGRWVVSQRAGAAPPGALVHGASRTGRTQYVEPAPLVHALARLLARTPSARYFLRPHQILLLSTLSEAWPTPFDTRSRKPLMRTFATIGTFAA